MLHQSYLRKKFTYSPETGELLRKRKTVAPTPAANASGKISLAGYTYHVTDIAWAMATGEWPTRPVKTLDGTGDLRLSNLALVAPGENRPSPTKPEYTPPNPEEFIYYP